MRSKSTKMEKDTSPLGISSATFRYDERYLARCEDASRARFQFVHPDLSFIVCPGLVCLGSLRYALIRTREKILHLAAWNKVRYIDAAVAYRGGPLHFIASLNLPMFDFD